VIRPDQLREAANALATALASTQACAENMADVLESAMAVVMVRASHPETYGDGYPTDTEGMRALAFGLAKTWLESQLRQDAGVRRVA
jgi:hypothetical protein